MHETVPSDGNPKDGTNLDQKIAPEPTLIEEPRSSNSACAAMTNELEEGRSAYSFLLHGSSKFK